MRFVLVAVASCRHGAGPGVVIPAIFPGAGKRMIAMSCFESLARGQGTDDAREVTLDSVPVPALPLPPVIAIELSGPSDRSRAIRRCHRGPRRVGRTGRRSSRQFQGYRGGLPRSRQWSWRWVRADRRANSDRRQSAADGTPVHSLRTLLDHLFNVTADSTPTQQRAFELLGVNPAGVLPVDVQGDQTLPPESTREAGRIPDEVPPSVQLNWRNTRTWNPTVTE